VTGYAQIYLDLLREANQQGRLQVTAAAVIPSQQQLEAVGELQEWGAKIYPSYEEMLEKEHGNLDLCLIPTGIQWHARMTIAALKAGAHVLVEKPLAGSKEDAQAILDAEKKYQRWVAIGFQDIYATEARWLKSQLVDGSIGRLKKVRMIGIWPRPRAYFERNSWAGKLYADGAAAMDSPLNNAFAHFVNLSLYFAGRKAESAASVEISQADLLRAHDIESFDTAVVQARSDDNVRFWFGVTHSSRQLREPEIHIYGENGYAQWFHDRQYVLAPNGKSEIRRDGPDYAKTRQQMFDAVLARLQDGVTPICHASTALPHTHLISDLHQNFQIHTFDEEEISHEVVNPEQGEIPVVKDLDDVLDRAMKQDAALLSIRPYKLTELATS